MSHRAGSRRAKDIQPPMLVEQTPSEVCDETKKKKKKKKKKMEKEDFLPNSFSKAGGFCCFSVLVIVIAI